MLGITLILGATLALAAWAASWRFIAAQKDKTITEQARYIEDLQQSYTADMKQAREEGMALTVKKALKEGFEKGVGYGAAVSSLGREREAALGRE